MSSGGDVKRNAVNRGSLEDFVGYHLRRASGAFGSHFIQAMSGTELRQVTFGVLAVIDANPGINQGSVGRALGIQRANMVSLITDLERDGRVNRETAGKDRRAFSLTLTDAGRAALADALERVRLHEEALLKGMSADDRRKLIKLLHQVEKNAESL